MKKTILITAYAVNPFKGSEDGTGWNIIHHLSKKNNVIAITRRNNQNDIDKYLSELGCSEKQSLHFAYFDLPKWLVFWKKGSRGALLYHYLWHLGVVFFILKNKLRFDIAHHLNFHSDWTPTFLWLLGKPFVWGPLGHHHKIPREYILQYGKKAWLKDRLMWWAKKMFWTFDPFLKISKWTATKVIGVNSSVFKMLHVAENRKYILPAVAAEMPTVQPIKNDKFQILTIGRFVPLKGFDVAIRSYASCFHRQKKETQERMQLTLIGEGPEKERLKKIAIECNLPSYAIRFIDWLGREELALYFASAKIFLFPSHEGAGMVVPEALSYHLPVICFDNYGPGENINESCGIKIPYLGYDESIECFSDALCKMIHDDQLLSSMSNNAFSYWKERFTWQKKNLYLQNIYNDIFMPSHAFVV